MTEAEKLLAIEEIKQLRARFARTMDTKDWNGMEATLSPDCTFDFTQEAGTDELVRGAEDIVAEIRRNLINATSVHHAHMPEIEITSATTAKGLWAMQDLLHFPGVPTVDLVGYGHYHETYEKSDGRWRIKTFKLTRLRVDVSRTMPPNAPPMPAPAPRQVQGGRTVKAARVHAYGGPERLVVEQIPEPIPGPGEILVKVAAAAVNPVDAKLRRGTLDLFMPLAFPAQIGGDLAGTVEAVGPGVTDWKPGDRVMAFINPAAEGAYAEKAIVPTVMAIHVPEGISLSDAAAIPTGVATGVQLVERGVKPKPGDKILVTGAGGSVGRAAVYAAADAGATVVAGVRSSSRAALEGLPLAGIVDLNDESAVAAAGPFDGIADAVGGRLVEKLCRHVKPGGTVATAVLPPVVAPEGSGVTVIPVIVQPDAPRLVRFAEGVAQGRYTVPIAKRFALSEAAEAHRLFDKGGVGGKILLMME
ncbi:MAG TPA: nuclear transport factor 2 family protein [Alphaproteobacteria bacterium]|nr:nuclear transport factor 2 family protein [Alphaproteobacteria bacterium]